MLLTFDFDGSTIIRLTQASSAQPNPAMIRANAAPNFLAPTIPTILANMSKPIRPLRSKSPSRTRLWARRIFRLRVSISATVLGDAARRIGWDAQHGQAKLERLLFRFGESGRFG
jgi:hypothetical protein